MAPPSQRDVDRWQRTFGPAPDDRGRMSGRPAGVEPVAMAIAAVPRTSLRRACLVLGVSVLTMLTLAPATRAADPAAPQRHGSAERLGLRLLNCTRTGGWVRADGTCKGRGSGKHSSRMPALRLHGGISDRVAYRWSAELVRARTCAHDLDGHPGVARRFTLAGFRYPSYGENIGCGWSGTTVRQMVIRSHLAMQAEKRSGGGHWRNMKNRGFKSVGIGVASLDGWTTIVYDFYGR
jgi:hypothetical protein